jgi:hypothetical protein
MMPWMSSGGVPNVGGHSVASRIPRRPLVPAPTRNLALHSGRHQMIFVVDDLQNLPRFGDVDAHRFRILLLRGKSLQLFK